MSRLMDLMEKVLRDGIAKIFGNFDKNGNFLFLVISMLQKNTGVT